MRNGSTYFLGVAGACLLFFQAFASPPAPPAPPAPAAPAQGSAQEVAGLLRQAQAMLEAPRAKLLILGVFHFEDAGLDDYKPKYHVNILSESSQHQLEEITDQLARFRPTKVAVEWPKRIQAKADRLYKKYLDGNLDPRPNEVIQLGFRLAAVRKHPRVWLVDVKGRRYQPAIDRSAIAREWGVESVLDSEWWPRYEKLSHWSDELKTKIPLIDYLVFLNSEPMLQANHGQYFVGGFNLIRNDEYPGPDHLATWWYDRNLRIFANVRALVESPDERIVLIIGHGHVPILRDAAQASPDIELVSVADVLAR